MEKLSSLPIDKEKLPALLSFLFLFFPFFQGMDRYFTTTYSNIAAMPEPYSRFLMIDGIDFTIEAALFFAMSRALIPERWRHFYYRALLVIVFDFAWGIWSLWSHGADTTCWIALDFISMIVLAPMLFITRKRASFERFWPFRLEGFWPWSGCTLMLFRTVADYYYGWVKYFPHM